jgi:shikimate dehydrogenase
MIDIDSRNAEFQTLTGRSRLAGIVGWPVAHSRSPRLHGYWLRKHGIDGAYVPLPVRPENLEHVLRVLPHLGLVGVNVTVPHKEAALAAVDVATTEARTIGAVNTIVVAADGKLEGSNTDAFGFSESLKAVRSDWNAQSGPAVVLGAGGAARAVVYALVAAGSPEIRLVNRTHSRAARLASAMGGACRVIEWKERDRALAGAAILVNATTLGMTGQPPLEIDLEAMAKSTVVVDIVYTPLETPLLASARTRGNCVVDGLGMLLHQARPAFAAWFGIDPAVTEELRRFVLMDSG